MAGGRATSLALLISMGKTYMYVPLCEKVNNDSIVGGRREVETTTGTADNDKKLGDGNICPYWAVGIEGVELFGGTLHRVLSRVSVACKCRNRFVGKYRARSMLNAVTKRDLHSKVIAQVTSGRINFSLSFYDAPRNAIAPKI
jgi:hypothetical protein